MLPPLGTLLDDPVDPLGDLVGDGDDEVVAMGAPPPVPPTMQISAVETPLPTPGPGTNPSGPTPAPDELQ